MISNTLTVVSPVDGLKLSAMTIEPDNGQIKGVIQFVHGMAEMKERYQDFMTFLASKGYACIIHDHRGHGKSVISKADLGYLYEGGGDSLVEDAHAVTLEAKKLWPDKKIALFGHSMGSLVVRCYVRKYDADIDSLIVMGAPAKNGAVGIALKLVSVLTKLKGSRHRSELINKMAFGSYLKGIDDPRSPFDWLSVNAENVDFYIKNEYCGFTFTLDGFRGLFELVDLCYRDRVIKTSCPSLPVIFLSGENDPCIGSAANFDEAMNAMRKQGYTTVEGTLYPGLRHEILNEGRKLDIYHDILNWLEKKGI